MAKELPQLERAAASTDGGPPTVGRFRYRRLRNYSILLTSLVSLTPLIAMTVINIHQYQQAHQADMIYPIGRQTANIRHALEAFIRERQSALNLIINERTFEELHDHDALGRTLSHLKGSFGGFVDLGLIDSDGKQVAYAGPYPLEGKNYKTQDWFHEVNLRGVYVSDVFMGYRGFPHFVIAVKHDLEAGAYYILRASIDSDMLYKRILAHNLNATSDAFLINEDGILQTPSRHHGKVLEKCELPIPPYSATSEVIELTDQQGQPYILGYSHISNTPYILMETFRPQALMQNWLTTRNQLIAFLAVSIVLILIVIVAGTLWMVGKIREADLKRFRMLHHIEYTNKMASIGRVAAGVAHEINNPMAVINESAGMIKDLLSVEEPTEERERINRHVTSILKSVDRCSRITHRLLGFARRMESHIEEIDLRDLMEEVFGFLGKEALHRNIEIKTDFDPNVPPIASDKGQLQQVFLNILSNALEAVQNGGEVHVALRPSGRRWVEVVIRDNGPGIRQEDLDRIFEPFFTTKKQHGTGLGLSITYGIVQKLGGRIRVESQIGSGTTFRVTLPIRAEATKE